MSRSSLCQTNVLRAICGTTAIGTSMSRQRMKTTSPTGRVRVTSLLAKAIPAKERAERISRKKARPRGDISRIEAHPAIRCLAGWRRTAEHAGLADCLGAAERLGFAALIVPGAVVGFLGIADFAQKAFDPGDLAGVGRISEVVE